MSLFESEAAAQTEVHCGELLFSAFIPGTVKPKGSVSAFAIGGRARVVHKRPKEWEQAIRYAVSRGLEDGQILVPRDRPVRIALHFVMPRPKSASKRASPWRLANKRPDGDKLERAVWDAVTGLLVVDDCQFVQWEGSKRVAEENEQPGVLIHLWSVA